MLLKILIKRMVFFSSLCCSFDWTDALADDNNAPILSDILRANVNHARDLANFLDERGRRSCDIASTMCKRAFQTFLFFLGRYEFTSTRPEHKSNTCCVMLAKDKNTSELVAMKFMKHDAQFNRELASRQRFTDSSSDAYVIEVYARFNGDEDEAFHHELELKGFAEYNYLLIFPAADRDLQRIMAKENIAGKEWEEIRRIFREVVSSVSYLHRNGVIHGDVKPLVSCRPFPSLPFPSLIFCI